MTQAVKQKLTEVELYCDHLLSDIQKLEPSDAEICASHTQTTKVIFEHKDFSVSASDESTNYGLRMIQNGKQGFVTTNSLSRENIKNFALEAQGLCRLSPVNEHQHVGTDLAGESYAEMVDKKISEMEPKQILDFASLMIEQARKDPRISIDRAELSVTTNLLTLRNSKGVKRSLSQSSCDWFVMGMGKTPTEVTSFDFEGDSVSEYHLIESRIKESISRFTDSAIGSLGAKKGNTYKGLVLFHPYAVMDLIGEVIAANVNGLSHADSISPWKNKLGKQVASSLLDAFEDPLNRSRSSGWRTFDREGTRCLSRDLLTSGMFNSIVHNSFSASRMGTKTTGNAIGGPRGLPSVGLSNFGLRASVKADKVSDKKLTEMLGNGLVFKRFSGNSDTVSGEFSGIAKNSWIINNKENIPVQEVMVSGNAFDVLNNIVAVGSQSYELMGGISAPYILVEGLSVTAG